MKYYYCFAMLVFCFTGFPLLAQEEIPESAPASERAKRLRLEFVYSLNVRNTTPHPALEANWDAYTPEDAIAYREDWLSTPYGLELNYYASDRFSIGPFVRREIYKMRDKKENEYDQAQAPSGTYVPSGYYDIIFESKYLMKFVPLMYGVQLRYLIPMGPEKRHFVSLQGEAGAFTLYNSKYKFNRINEEQEIFKPVNFIFTFMSPLKTTQVNFSGNGTFYGGSLGYFRAIKGAKASYLGLELNWQASILQEIKTRVTTYDDTYPGFSVDNPGQPIPYPVFVERDEDILWDTERQIPAQLDFGGLSASLTLRMNLSK